MKKSTIAIISVVCTLAICLGAYFINDYSSKRDGRTRESRELVLREELDADFIICERKIDGIIYSAFEFLNGRTGVTGFEQKGTKYKTSGLYSKYSDSDVPNVHMAILNKKYCYIIFLNQENMEYAEVVYEVTTYSGKQEEVVFKYDLDDDRIICSESPQAGQPKRIIYYDSKGQEYNFIEDPDGTREYYVKNNT